MTTISSFVTRLEKMGISVTLLGNYPWVYLDTVNEKTVQGTYMSDHKFTVFMIATKPGDPDKIMDLSTIFKKIRETLNN